MNSVTLIDVDGVTHAAVDPAAPAAEVEQALREMGFAAALTQAQAAAVCAAHTGLDHRAACHMHQTAVLPVCPQTHRMVPYRRQQGMAGTLPQRA